MSGFQLIVSGMVVKIGDIMVLIEIVATYFFAYTIAYLIAPGFQSLIP